MWSLTSSGDQSHRPTLISHFECKEPVGQSAAPPNSRQALIVKQGPCIQTDLAEILRTLVRSCRRLRVLSYEILHSARRERPWKLANQPFLGRRTVGSSPGRRTILLNHSVVNITPLLRRSHFVTDGGDSFRLNHFDQGRQLAHIADRADLVNIRRLKNPCRGSGLFLDATRIDAGTALPLHTHLAHSVASLLSPPQVWGEAGGMFCAICACKPVVWFLLFLWDW